MCPSPPTLGIFFFYGMAKRFTDTEIWDKEWFMDLTMKEKLLIRFLFDKCDVAGIWSPNWILASTYIGEKVTISDMAKFKNRIQVLADGKIFVKDFIPFQYGTLSETCKPHIKVLEILEKYNLLDSQKIKGYEYPIQRVQEEEKDKDKEEEKDKEGESMREETDNQLSPMPIKYIPVGVKDPIVPSMREIYKKYNPGDFEESNDFESYRLIAVEINRWQGWGANAYEKEKKKETLDLWDILLSFSRTDNFYRKLTLNALSKTVNIRGLIKAYKESLTPKINGNGKHSGNPAKSMGKDFESTPI